MRISRESFSRETLTVSSLISTLGASITGAANVVLRHHNPYYRLVNEIAAPAAIVSFGGFIVSVYLENMGGSEAGVVPGVTGTEPADGLPPQLPPGPESGTQAA